MLAGEFLPIVFRLSHFVFSFFCPFSSPRMMSAMLNRYRTQVVKDVNDGFGNFFDFRGFSLVLLV
jgi:hypothetical protein